MLCLIVNMTCVVAGRLCRFAIVPAQSPQILEPGSGQEPGECTDLAALWHSESSTSKRGVRGLRAPLVTPSYILTRAHVEPPEIAKSMVFLPGLNGKISRGEVGYPC